MAFKENKTRHEAESLDQAILDIFMELTGGTISMEDIEEWPESDKEYPPRIDDGEHHEKSLVAKVDLLCHNTLDDLLSGNIALENGVELLQIIQAVDSVNGLKVKYKDV